MSDIQTWTLVFVVVAAPYLGVLDLAFNWLVQRVI